jgi:arabinofuranosyltransferase
VNEKRIHWLIWSLIGLGIGYAWLFRHVEDDAFITFRYSKHLVAGDGPVWNADQRVEGYTNFLWMLLMAVPIWLGLDPVLPAILVSFAFLGGNLWLLYQIARRVAAQPQDAFWTWLPVLASHTLLLFATSGMETTMNGALWTMVFWQLTHIQANAPMVSRKQFFVLGILLGLCFLSRPEGALLVLGCAILRMRWSPHSGARRLQTLASLLLPVALLLLPWLAWKWAFYGSLIPNTFYAKTGTTSLWSGLKYCGFFGIASGCWIPILLLAGKPRGPRYVQPCRLTWPAWTLVGAFLLYALFAGGDYLEFRLLTPILPLVLMLPLLQLSQRRLPAWRLPVASIAMVLLAFGWGQGHGRIFKIWQMNALIHPITPDAHALNFAAQGKALGALLQYDESIRLAIGACGAIPYYSNLYGIDLYGLNEPRHEFTSYATGYGPGHARLGDFRFIQLKKPHLISLRCDYLPDLPATRTYRYADVQVAEIVHGFAGEAKAENLKIVELPLGNGFAEVCIYYQAHPTIDSAIKNNSLKIYQLQ